MIDESYMRMACNLMKDLHRQTSPNPSVGAVVVNNNEVVGMGAHLTYGDAHAEVIALEMAGGKARGSTLYVTLEPCNHVGKTQPCTDAIIQAGVKRVVIACEDPHEVVAGKGITALRAANIEVTTGVLEDEVADMYEAYFHYIQTGRPYVTMKSASTLDGKTATHTGDSKWITSMEARKDAHSYRSQHDAILVGIGTVLADNPSLTTHLVPGGRNPIRIILDTHLRTPNHAQVVTDEQVDTWIFTGNHVSEERKNNFMNRPFVKVIEMPTRTYSITDVLVYLGKHHITSVFVEGGSHVHGAFLQEDRINQYIVYLAPKCIGGSNGVSMFGGEGIHRIAEAKSLTFTAMEQVGPDVKIIAKPGGM